MAVAAACPPKDTSISSASEREQMFQAKALETKTCATGTVLLISRKPQYCVTMLNVLDWMCVSAKRKATAN